MLLTVAILLSSVLNVTFGVSGLFVNTLNPSISEYCICFLSPCTCKFIVLFLLISILLSCIHHGFLKLSVVPFPICPYALFPTVHIFPVSSISADVCVLPLLVIPTDNIFLSSCVFTNFVFVVTFFVKSCALFAYPVTYIPFSSFFIAIVKYAFDIIFFIFFNCFPVVSSNIGTGLLVPVVFPVASPP